MRRGALASGIAVLVLVWLGPLPSLARQAFSAHMVMHVSVVALAAPLIAVGLAGDRFDPSRRFPALFAPIPASALELVVVWGWHAPALHHAARSHEAALAIKQGSFLLAGLLVWFSAFGGDPDQRERRTAAGIVGLLLTSMHMTLLGALLALALRPVYPAYLHASAGPIAFTPLEDQHLGGAIMLLGGGTAYLAGGLTLMARLLRSRQGTRKELS